MTVQTVHYTAACTIEMEDELSQINDKVGSCGWIIVRFEYTEPG